MEPPEPNRTTQIRRESVERAGDSARLNLWLREGGEPDELRELGDVLRNAGARDVGAPLFADPRPGYRGGEGGVVDGIADVVATLEPSVGLVGRVIASLRGWLAGRPQRSIELTVGESSIKITGLSSANEDRMVEAFIQRVAKGE